MGYSRAFRAGDMVHVAGCVGIRDDGTYSPDLGEQTTRCLERIELALAPFGVDLSHVVRLRLFVTCHRWQEIAAVVGPRFAAARPANAMVEVARLIDPQAMIEIEADAWIPPAVSART